MMSRQILRFLQCKFHCTTPLVAEVSRTLFKYSVTHTIHKPASAIATVPVDHRASLTSPAWKAAPPVQCSGMGGHRSLMDSNKEEFTSFKWWVTDRQERRDIMGTERFGRGRS